MIKSSKLSQALKTFTLKDYESLPDVEKKDSEDTSFFSVDGSANLKISIANNMDDRIKAYQLLYEVYTKKEFAKPNKSKMWYSLFDAHDETITFIVKDSDEVIGALTVIIDSPLGLPADNIYADKLNQLRTEKRKPAEIISLGISENTRGTQKVLLKLFNFAYLATRGLYGVDDFIITVNPKHTAFYERKFYFDVMGEERTYGKVGGAVAVLLNLNFNKIEEFVKKFRAGEIHKKNTIYRYFYDISQKMNIVQMIKRSHKPMSLDEFEYFFSDQRTSCSHHNRKQFNYLRNKIGLGSSVELMSV